MNSPLIAHFSIIPDPRRFNHHGKRHELLDIIIITILGVICGAETWDEIELFGNQKEEFLKNYLTLENGIPSHDTFARVFSILDPLAFHECFVSWVVEIGGDTKGIIALDGKTVCGARSKGKKALHILNAYATESGLTIGQVKVDGKTNEITMIPVLLDQLFLKGTTITMDALGTQCSTTRIITDKEADYVLAVKKNQKRLLEDITHTFEKEKDHDYHKMTESGHGREEIRECWATDNLTNVRDEERWHGLTSIVKVTDTRIIGERKTQATRYFISSKESDAKESLGNVRAHWKIENSLHWSLDVSFGEDLSRVRRGHAAENLSLVRKIALNLVKHEKTTKVGIKSKRKLAGWDDGYLCKILGMEV